MLNFAMTLPSIVVMVAMTAIRMMRAVFLATVSGVPVMIIAMFACVARLGLQIAGIGSNRRRSRMGSGLGLAGFRDRWITGRAGINRGRTGDNGRCNQALKKHLA
ncbi:MAG: hypothetical protein ACK4FK_07180 [Ferrovibrio sp.]|uniref:hypothetical protein n=1 Tax=Ferrovibrio sp. TaxID=1917215 RepID=UPI00391BC975